MILNPKPCQALDYVDRPDYDLLVGLLEDLGGGISMTMPYDWEQVRCSSVLAHVSWFVVCGL
jgi:hypothetical protein